MACHSVRYLNCTRCKSDGTSSSTTSATYVKLPSGGTWYYITFSYNGTDTVASCSGGTVIQLYKDSNDTTVTLAMIAIRVA